MAELSQQTLDAWNQYYKEYLDSFSEKNGGIVGIMMDDEKQTFFNIASEIKLIDCYKHYEFCMVKYEEKEVKEMLCDKHIKFSFQGIDFTSSKVEYVDGDNNLKFFYGYNPTRTNPHELKFGNLRDVFKVESDVLKSGILEPIRIRDKAQLKSELTFDVYDYLYQLLLKDFDSLFQLLYQEDSK